MDSDVIRCTSTCIYVRKYKVVRDGEFAKSELRLDKNGVGKTAHTRSIVCSWSLR